MNNLIRELADQAIAHANQTWNPDSERWRFVLIAMEKHAELIIQECIRCCEQVISDPVSESVDTWLNGGEQCIQEIKEHFGIEE